MRFEFEGIVDQTGRKQDGHFAFEVQMLSRYRYKVIREQGSVRVADETQWFDRREDSFETNVDFLGNFEPRFVSSAGLFLQAVGGIFPFFFIQQFLGG